MPVLVDTNLIPTGADAGRRPADLLDRGQRRRPASTRPSTTSTSSSRSARAPTTRSPRSVNKRMSHGFQFQASYTLAKGEDNAPLTGTYVVGQRVDDRLSDPTNVDRDKGLDALQPDPHLRLQQPDPAPGRGRRPGRGARQQQPARRHRPGQQRAAVQHPLEPGPEPGRRHQRPAARHRAQLGPAGHACSTSTRATCASSTSAGACAPSCSRRRRTCSTGAARIRPRTRPATRTCRR